MIPRISFKSNSKLPQIDATNNTYVIDEGAVYLDTADKLLFIKPPNNDAIMFPCEQVYAKLNDLKDWDFIMNAADKGMSNYKFGDYKDITLTIEGEETTVPAYFMGFDDAWKRGEGSEVLTNRPVFVFCYPVELSTDNWSDNIYHSYDGGADLSGTVLESNPVQTVLDSLDTTFLTHYMKNRTKDIRGWSVSLNGPDFSYNIETKTITNKLILLSAKEIQGCCAKEGLYISTDKQYEGFKYRSNLVPFKGETFFTRDVSNFLELYDDNGELVDVKTNTSFDTDNMYIAKDVTISLNNDYDWETSSVYNEKHYMLFSFCI